jgi:prolyl 4-hydroxylase
MTQPITPELRQWVIDQAAAGCRPEDVLQSMLDAGWQETVALDAMETILQVHLKSQQPGVTLPQPVPVPDVNLTDMPLTLDLGDRTVTVLAAMNQPRVVVLGGFLSDEECDAMVDAARPRMSRSLTVSVKTGGEEINADRTSTGMFFQRGETPLVQRVEERIARLLNWPIENGEGMQVLNYHPGAEYKPHYDYFDPAEPGTPTILKRGGQRVGTFLMYLNNPDKGGGTTFPDVNFAVGPVRGNAVFFSYDRAHPSTKSLHGGAPVVEGQKWIATKWLREREFK